MTEDIFSKAREFVRRDGRLVERRLFGTLFEGADPAGVVDALRGYQNADGGFGHGLEPDKRCPDSLAVDVEVAFQTLVTAGTVDEELVRRACDWLATVATPDGAVSPASPAIESYPRAVHWSDWAYEPDLNPTAGLAGALYELGVDHPWRSAATDWCWSALDTGLPVDAHGLRGSLAFLAHVPDRARAEAFVSAIREGLPKLRHYRAEATDPAYGVTPLDLAPTPDSWWRQLFTDDQLEAHLDRLERDQQEDGGWAISWEPPGVAATLEYRGVMTVHAVGVLRAYGRL